MGKRKVSLVVLLLFVHILLYKIKYSQTKEQIFRNGFNNIISTEKARLEYANITACDCGWRNSQFLEIVNGQETGVNEFPAMAALISSSTRSLYCGAHIISDKYLLTAAHCIYQNNPSDILVLVGDHNISSGSDTPYSAIYQINAYEINPNYDPKTYNNDIGIVQTVTSIEFSNYVGPICLPFRYYLYDFNGYPAIILGWGLTEFTGPISDVLLGASTYAISNNVCQSLSAETISQQEICTYAEINDSCQFDSGGPVLVTDPTFNRMYLVGIISHGVGCASGSPAINTRVTAFLDWIITRTSDWGFLSGEGFPDNPHFMKPWKICHPAPFFKFHDVWLPRWGGPKAR